MTMFDCVASLPAGEFEAKTQITEDALVVRSSNGKTFELPYADLLDMRLLNYRLRLTMIGYEAQIFRLGYQTEDFFEKLWEAYEKRTCKALFVEGNMVMQTEGDYAYTEPDGERHGIAKLQLYSDCLCILPHDAGARRVPLCFCEVLVQEGFALTLSLDTNERYRIARLGRDTDPFFSLVRQTRDRSLRAWRAAHAALDMRLSDRLGQAKESYEVLCQYAEHVFYGLFSFDDEAFWVAGLRGNRAAIELVTDEKTALYLYEFDVTQGEFELRLRHAIEAVKTNRRVIFAPDTELSSEPLFRMAIARSSHVRFLRACNVGRIVHTGAWESRLSHFLAG